MKIKLKNAMIELKKEINRKARIIQRILNKYVFIQRIREINLIW